MQKLIFIFVCIPFIGISQTQSVGIGTTTPAAKLEIQGVYSNPTIPGITSTGILRIGVTEDEGIDIGKMGAPTYGAWIQAGFAGVDADPLYIQPLGGNVGIGTSSPSAAAALEVKSSTQGFLPPRLTYVQRNAITNPVAGLVVWCSNCGIYGELQVYRGTIWTNMIGGTASSQIVIGSGLNNMIVGYIFQPGEPGYIAGETHGIITAVSVSGSEYIYGCISQNMPTNTGLGAGNLNTFYIGLSCFEVNSGGKVCYQNFLVLPSKDELNKLYVNRVAIGGFNPGLYLSSSQVSIGTAWVQNFDTGAQIVVDKDFPVVMRPIQYF